MNINKDIDETIAEFNKATDAETKLMLCQKIIEYLHACSNELSKFINKDYIGIARGDNHTYCVILGKTTLHNAIKYMHIFENPKDWDDDSILDWKIKDVDFNAMTTIRQVGYLEKACDELKIAREYNLGAPDDIRKQITDKIISIQNLCTKLINKLEIEDLSDCDRFIFKLDFIK